MLSFSSEIPLAQRWNYVHYLVNPPRLLADNSAGDVARFTREPGMGKLQLAGRMRDALRTLVPAALNISQAHRDTFPSIERDGLIARCHSDWPDDAQFILQWSALRKRNSWATAFASPAWQSAVVDEFVPAGKFRLITVHRGDELVALLPLSFNTASMLETPGRWVTDYLDPLIESQTAPACWKIILEYLQELWDWSVGGIVLHHIRGDSNIRKILPTFAPQIGFTYAESDLQKAPYIALPKTWEEYLATLDGSERKNIRRKIRNAQTRNGARLEIVTEEEECAAALERALAAMRQSKSTKADFTEEILIGFLRRLCPRLIRQGDFRIQELYLDDRPAAWMLEIRSNRGPMIYNTSYDHAQRNLSPGAVGFGLAIQQAIADGSDWFNFLRGGEEYKKRMGGVDLDLIKITLRPG
jgi:CelD/BcsL family acetyltransferase involved in cellulose biosynthesis